jgi:hypothetical protein
MGRALNTRQIEGRLIESLRKDRSKRSRCSTRITPEEGTVITVNVSNDTYGLAIAVGAHTGEDDPMVVIERLSEDV